MLMQGPSAGTANNANGESQPEIGLDKAKYEAELQARSEEVLALQQTYHCPGGVSVPCKQW
jgi:hypothetical protein